MAEIQNQKKYNLEERTFIEDTSQLVRSSGSMGANYIEANEALGKKDFVFRIKICRKESKESRYWLRLIDLGDNSSLEKEREELIQEATELMMIYCFEFRLASLRSGYSNFEF